MVKSTVLGAYSFLETVSNFAKKLIYNKAN